jgi:hypothetical protein
MAGNNGAMNRREKFVLTSGAQTATNFSSGTGAIGDPIYFSEPKEIVGLFVYVVTAIYGVATLVDMVISLYKSGSLVPAVQPQGASTSYIKITVPTVATPGKAAGTVYRRLCNPVIVLPGQPIVLNITTAAAASPQGTFMCGVLVDYHPEVGANMLNLVDVTA